MFLFSFFFSCYSLLLVFRGSLNFYQQFAGCFVCLLTWCGCSFAATGCYRLLCCLLGLLMVFTRQLVNTFYFDNSSHIGQSSTCMPLPEHLLGLQHDHGVWLTQHSCFNSSNLCMPSCLASCAGPGNIPVQLTPACRSMVQLEQSEALELPNNSPNKHGPAEIPNHAAETQQ